MAQKITKMHLKRAVSAFLAVATAITAMPPITISAEETEKYPYTLFAGSYSEGAITTTAGNFCVNGNVATNGTIIAAGNMNINGTKTENAGEEMIYIFNKIESKYFSGNNVDEYAEDYTLEEMNINVTEPLEVGGEIEMTGNINLTTAIKAYDTVSLNGEVKNTSESVICSETGDIIIDCTNVNLNGLVYAPDGSVEITAQNLNLNNVIIIADTILLDCPNVNANYGSSVAEFIGTESEVVPIIYAIGTYNAEENCIDIMWSTNCEDGSFEIMYSDDDVTYTSVDTVTGTDTYKYLITEDFAKRYFKVVLTTAYGETVEATPFIVTKTEDGYISDLYDTDGDEVADILEELIGTDIEDVDTDDDGLTDYQEYCITGTDPLVYDSVTTGISDADADADNDGLTTTQEIENNTNPQSADTDSDTLSDYEELYTYGTDPLSPDTDEDTISDGNELNVGLDPLNPETFGVPDAEYKQVQTISADSEALSAINTAENPYKLSIEFTATGYAESALTAKETGYAVAIDNDSMFGIAPELIYSGECEDITLKFEITDEYLDYSVSNEEIAGVKRYNVFKFYEDTNMLLPIVTYYDIDNDTIYAEVDELGTYCVMDMVSWFESFGILLEDYQPEPMLMTLSDDYMLASAEETSEDELAFAGGPADVETATVEETIEEEVIQENELMVAEAPMLMSAYSLSSDEELTKAQTPLDLVFILQAEGNSEKRFEEHKQAVIDTSELVFNYFDDARISIIYFDYYSASWFMNGWFRDLSSIEDNIDDIVYENIARYCDRDKAFNVLLNRLSYRDNAAKFVFNLVDGWSYSSNFANHIDVCNSERFNYSEMWAEGWGYVYESDRIEIESLIYSTGGIVDRIDDDVHQVMYDHICDYITPPQVEYDVFYLMNWHPVVLDAPIKPNGNTDTDDDGKTDWNEILNQYLSWDSSGDVVLPTISECMYAISNELAIQEMEAFFETPFYGPIYYDHLNNGYALPVITNPELPDTDGDGLKDWTVTYNKDNTRVIAPADNNPLKETVPHGIWNKHLEEEESGELIATDYSKNNNGFKLIPYQEIADFLVMVLLNYLYDPIEENQEKIRPILLYIKDLADPHTEIGAYFLNFILDNKELAYHSQIETWQKTLGYNDFYDLFFGTASYMLHETIEFSSNNKDYILWLWKGDYWNLQSGAEMGLYVASDKPEISSDSGIPHYEVVDFTLPMTLDLYTFENNSISTILKWHPVVDQWWITGFCHTHTYSNPKDMTMITSINFANKFEDSTGKYIEAEKLYEDFLKAKIDNEIDSKGKYDLIFDDENLTVWIVFYEGAL